MPASYVHQSIAMDAYEKLKDGVSLESGLTGGFFIPAYLAGAEGPDLFFFTLFAAKKYTRPSYLGHIGHTRETGEFLAALLKNAGEDPLLQSYAYGFLSHYAADTVCHPFIHARSFDEEGKYSPFLHSTYEHKLETYFCRKRGHATGLPLHMRGFNELTSGEKDRIAALLEQTLAEVYTKGKGYDLCYPTEIIRKGMDQAALFGRFLKTERQKKHSLILWIGLRLPIASLVESHLMPLTITEADLTNQAHALWHSPWEPKRERTESFDELFAAAVERTVTLLQTAGSNEKSDYGNLSYDSGLDWTQSEDLTA